MADAPVLGEALLVQIMSCAPADRGTGPVLQVGMRHFNIRKNHYFQPIINLDKLWSLLGNEVS